MDNRLKKIEINRRLEILEINSKLDKYLAIAGMGAYFGIILIVAKEKILEELPLVGLTTLAVGVAPFVITKLKKNKYKNLLEDLNEKELER